VFLAIRFWFISYVSQLMKPDGGRGSRRPFGTRSGVFVFLNVRFDHVALLICLHKCKRLHRPDGQDLMDAGIGRVIHRISEEEFDCEGKERPWERTRARPDGRAVSANFSKTHEWLGDGLIRMEEDLTSSSPQMKRPEVPGAIVPGPLIADAPSSGADDMQFGLGHGSFESEQEPIVKESRCRVHLRHRSKYQ